MSKYVNDNDCDCVICEPKHPLPKKVLFECGNPGGSMTFTTEGQSFIASSVAIDTACLCSPKVTVEFSNMVTFNIVDGIVSPFETRLQFELVKVCENGQEISCATHMYEKLFFDNNPINIPFTLTDSFAFVFCECSTCPGCCNYFVRVTADVISTNILTMENNVTATVSNGRMSIFASGC
ncbi:DUF4489 domain-containing protein [Wukongibacter baidiensis]|uniref:DUF4489 domain-containing protein n=1 Tax=Wukongibacter baidiensis TaxID=1723361 RepID=UPI003D7F3C59